MNKRVAKVGRTLALGAALNVAVAWTCAAALDPGQGRVSELYTRLPGERHWEVYRWDRVAGTRVFSKCWEGFAPGPFNRGDPAFLLASWGRIQPPEQLGTAIDEGWGLPLRTLTLHTVTARAGDGPVQTVRRGVFTLTMPGVLGGRTFHLPLVPAWGGVLLNTIVYALAVVVLGGSMRDLAGVVGRWRTGPAAA